MVLDTFRKVKWYVIKKATLLYSWFHSVDKKVLFESFGGKQYADNPRAISEKMHELYPDFD